MNEVMEKVNLLIEELEKSSTIQNLKKKKNEVFSNPHLFSLLKEYEEARKEEIKQEIIQDPLFQEYKEEEININLLILEINQRLKKIKEKGECNCENH